MHRTQGEDYILESGKRRFAQANPPTQKATRLPAEFMNAVQEEICNVIAAATPAITLNPTAADDRTAGWSQLLKAIQEGHLVKSTSFASDALSKGLAVDTNFTNVANSRAEATLYKTLSQYPFLGLYATYKDPGAAPRQSRVVPLSVISQALGGTLLIFVEQSGQTVDLSLSSYGEDWNGNICIVVTNGNTDDTLFITGAPPTLATITIINAGWAPSYDTESSYGLLSWSGVYNNRVLRTNYTLISRFNGNGSVVSTSTIPQHDTAINGTPAFWSRLHGIYDFKTRYIETPMTMPESGNSAYPHPLLVLDQTSDNTGGSLGGGVRVAGNVGIELPQASVSRATTSRKRRTGRIYHSVDGEVMFDRGTDSLGVARGHTRLDRAGVLHMNPFNRFDALSTGFEQPLWATREDTYASTGFIPQENCVVEDFGALVSLYSSSSMPCQFRLICKKVRMSADMRTFNTIQTSYADMLPFPLGPGGQHWGGKLTLNNPITLRPNDFDQCHWYVEMLQGYITSNAGIYISVNATALRH